MEKLCKNFPLVLLVVVVATNQTSFCLASESNDVARGIFSFGDSILDAGTNHFNQNCSAQADFPPYGSSFFHRPTGRFTNGRTGVTSLQVQLQQFKTLVEQNHTDQNIIKKSIFFLESGSNDIFGYFLPFDTPTLSPEAYVQAMLVEVGKFIDQIYKLGARRIALFSLGPVGCVPARALLGGPANKCYGKMNKMVKDYNKGLESLVNDIPVKYPGAVGVYGAVYDVVQRFRSIPTRYGFTNVTDACCGDGLLGGELQCGREGYKICAKPNEYLFWDYFHPTEHAYKIISKALWAGTTARIRPVNLKTLANITLATRV
ncbi:Lipase [Trema orientale]|uniref:Lipase n=1 Tax=Trema orientale TaxID=63057 RepID=A0A2P5CA88_TREOI|nr:Lipase [Trema orientale]